MKVKSLNDFLCKIGCIDKNQKIYIWGVCVYGDMLGKLLNGKEIPWHGYFDNFNKVEGGRLNDKPVYKGSELNGLENAFYILSMRNYEDVQKQLLENGINDECILYFENAKILDDIGESLTECAVSTKQLKRLYHIHKGDKCFIVGNGPSLLIEDLEMIHKYNIISFASNLIFRCYQKTQWRPDYYFFTDGVGIRETFRDPSILSYVSKNCKYMFSRNNGNLQEYSENAKNLLLFKYVFSESQQNFDFSKDCSEKIYIGYSVTYAMIQMAVYMGFRKIYLLGMDHNFSMEKSANGTIVKNEGIENHSKLLGDYALWGIPDLMQSTKAYMSAREYTDLHGIKIYNATRGGKLEVFERVNLDLLFQGSKNEL